MTGTIELYTKDNTVLSVWNPEDFRDENAITLGTGKNVRISFDPEGPEMLLAALIREEEQWFLTAAGKEYPFYLEEEELYHAAFKPGLRYRIGECFLLLNSEENTEKTEFSLLWKDKNKTVRCTCLKLGTTPFVSAEDGGFRIRAQGRSAFEIHTDGKQIFHVVTSELDEHNEKKIKSLSVVPGEQFSFGSFTGVVLETADAEKALSCKDPMGYPAQELRHKLKLYFVMALMCLLFVLLLQVYAGRKEKALRKKFNICRELPQPEVRTPPGKTAEQTILKLRNAGMYANAEKLCRKEKAEDKTLLSAVRTEKKVYDSYLLLDDKYFRFLADMLRFENDSSSVEAVGEELKHRTGQLEKLFAGQIQILKDGLSGALQKNSSLLRTMTRKAEVLNVHSQYISHIFELKKQIRQENWESAETLLNGRRAFFTYFSRQKVYDDAVELVEFHLKKIPAIYQNIDLKNIAAYRKENIADIRKKLDEALKGLEDNTFFPYEKALRNRDLELKRMETVADFAENLNVIREKEFSPEDMQKLLQSYRLVRKFSDPEMKYAADFLERCRQEIISYIGNKFNQLEKLPPRPVFADTAEAMIMALEQLGEHARLDDMEKFKRKINRHFAGIWNELHTDYKVAAANGNRKEAKEILKKMLAMGPCADKYYLWAVQEQKKLEENN